MTPVWRSYNHSMTQIDETLFFQTCAVPAANETKAAIRRRR